MSDVCPPVKIGPNAGPTGGHVDQTEGVAVIAREFAGTVRRSVTVMEQIFMSQVRELGYN